MLNRATRNVNECLSDDLVNGCCPAGESPEQGDSFRRVVTSRWPVVALSHKGGEGSWHQGSAVQGSAIQGSAIQGSAIQGSADGPRPPRRSPGGSPAHGSR